MEFRARARSHMVDILFALALFCVFAVSAVLCVLIGANVYRSTVRQMDENFSTRTSVSYVAEKVRQNDFSGGVSTGELGGQNALILEEKIGTRVYRTYLYCYEGNLCELFTEASNTVTPADGQKIMPLTALTARVDGKLLTVAVTQTDGRMEEFRLTLRSTP